MSKNHDCSEGYLFTKLIESLLTFILSTTENNEKGKMKFILLATPFLNHYHLNVPNAIFRFNPRRNCNFTVV